MKRKIISLLSALAIFTMPSCGSDGANPPILKNDGDCVSIVSIELTSSKDWKIYIQLLIQIIQLILLLLLTEKMASKVFKVNKALMVYTNN